MPYENEPKKTWVRKVWDETALGSMNLRDKSETESTRDLNKPLGQLLSDIHEETHGHGDPMTSFAGAQKRFASMMCQVAISNERVANQMWWLTVVIALLTVALVVMTIYPPAHAP
jgi:hypothetical protein